MAGRLTDQEKLDRADQLAAMNAAGVIYSELAALYNVSVSTIDLWIRDPLGEKERARKAQYGRNCLDCGKRTNGSDGHAKAAERCGECSTRRQSEALTIWTEQTVVAAIQRWAEIHGEPPVATDWHTSARAASGHWPPSGTVQRVFGTWNAAIEAAGFPPLAVGKSKRQRFQHVEAR